MWVKVCGTTTAEDALQAAEAGVDAVGFVLVRASHRHVGVMQVRAMADRMMAAGGRASVVERVGVFDPEDYQAEGGVAPDGHLMGGMAGAGGGWAARDLARVIVEDARAAGLTAVQMHGACDALGIGLRELACAVRDEAPELPVLPVVSWAVDTEGAGEQAVRELRGLRDAGFTRVLLDSKVRHAKGGTGVRFAWEEATRVLSTERDGLELVVAGGLGPDTVAEAVRTLRPWGVDAVSGVERALGRKDPERVRGYITGARAAELYGVP